ncbi:MAG TPA: hypothetical protein H9662_00170 [Firmicutes bacterium]|nr:hypothetical protein [Bacillota bacterium]
MTHPFSEKSDKITKWAGNSTTVNGKKYMPLHGRHNFDCGNYLDSTAEILRKDLAIPENRTPHAENRLEGKS